MEILKLIWCLLKLIIDIFLIWLMIYSFWYGIKIETGNLIIELYGINKHINK